MADAPVVALPGLKVLAEFTVLPCLLVSCCQLLESSRLITTCHGYPGAEPSHTKGSHKINNLMHCDTVVELSAEAL